MKICIFGSKGFIGSQLALGLSIEAKVRGVSLKLIELNDFNGTNFEREINCIGAELFINCIGRTPASSNQCWESFYSSNVLAPKRLIELASKFSVPQILHLSSCSVVDLVASDLALGNEQDYYTHSKYLGEQVFAENVSAATKVAIARLPLVYGEGIKSPFSQLLKYFSYNVPLPIRGYGAKGSYLGIENLTGFVCHFSLAQVNFDGIFELSDRNDLSLCDWADEVKTYLGVSGGFYFNFPHSIRRYTEVFGSFKQLYKYVYAPLKVTCSKAEDDMGWRRLSDGNADRQRLFGKIFDR